jgi:hypothetical protein
LVFSDDVALEPPGFAGSVVVIVIVDDIAARHRSVEIARVVAAEE